MPFHEALQFALWDLAAKEVGLPLHKLLGSRRDRENSSPRLQCLRERRHISPVLPMPATAS
ncbi:hypothetical protein ACC717_38385 [Rhizobium ruizarguesonis]